MDYALEEKLKFSNFTIYDANDEGQTNIKIEPIVLDEMAERKWGFGIPNSELIYFKKEFSEMSYYGKDPVTFRNINC